MVEQDQSNQRLFKPLFFAAYADPSRASQENPLKLGQGEVQMPAEEEHLQDPLPRRGKH